MDDRGDVIVTFSRCDALIVSLGSKRDINMVWVSYLLGSYLVESCTYDLDS